MAHYGLESRVGGKFNRKKVKDVACTREGREYLKMLHNGKYNVTLSEEVIKLIQEKSNEH